MMYEHDVSMANDGQRMEHESHENAFVYGLRCGNYRSIFAMFIVTGKYQDFSIVDTSYHEVRLSLITVSQFVVT